MLRKLQIADIEKLRTSLQNDNIIKPKILPIKFINDMIFRNIEALFGFKLEARKQAASLVRSDHPQEARSFCVYKYLKVSSSAL